MTVANPARCREKRLRYQRVVNRRIELHGKSFTISPAVSRPVLKVKDAKTKLEVGQSGSRGSRHQDMGGAFVVGSLDKKRLHIANHFLPRQQIFYHVSPFHTISFHFQSITSPKMHLRTELKYVEADIEMWG